MELSLSFFIFVFLILFLSFFVKGLAGFGDPLISNPLLALFLENKLISPANLCFSTPVNAYLSWKNRHAFCIKSTLPMALCILCGVIPGAMLLKYGSSWFLKALLGLLILAIGLEMITRKQAKPIHPNRIIMAVVCFCSGITAGLYGINLFFVAYVERVAKGREEFRGNICFIFLIENLFRFIVYFFSGVITREVLLLTLIALPGMAAGLWAGSMVDKKVSDTAIRCLTIAVFMLSGASVLIKAFFDIPW
ncbi:sulfite exporter TauE/SafE family protein [Clostridium minihomine]|uniref:sulfite exporter TauE/SafE family protein n=1 Tax=Clostridium minihomine TaxID=2045012 RepID=UPI000C7883CE|nr:sulfite exporter TauE/SafE family protein [Clostridium minihomine]